MSTEHFNHAKQAKQLLVAARREVVINLTKANNRTNRSDLLQIVETLAALDSIIKEENKGD